MRPAKLFKFKLKTLVLFLLSGLAALQPLSGLAVQTVTLGWNPSPSPSVRGYQIYYGTASHSYSPPITVSANATNATILGLVGGQTYYFAASSFNIAHAQSALSTEIAYTLPPDATNQPPILTKSLPSKAFVVGQNLSFSMAGIGTGPLKYQWSFNGQNLAGATNAVLTLNQVAANQAGTYLVTVTDNVGTTNSNPANLSMHLAAATTQVAATLTTVSGLATLTDASTQYAFDVSGVAGYTYVVQASTDLQNWVSVQTNVAPFTYVEPNADQSAQQFYRVAHN